MFKINQIWKPTENSNYYKKIIWCGANKIVFLKLYMHNRLSVVDEMYLDHLHIKYDFIEEVENYFFDEDGNIYDWDYEVWKPVNYKKQ